MDSDRGTIERIDFVIKYPSGIKKHVTLSNDPNDAKHNHYVLSEIAGVFFGVGGSIGSIHEHLESIDQQTVAEEWNRVSEGDQYKPAMVVLNADKSVHVMCGGHKNGPHPEPVKVPLTEQGRATANLHA